MATNTNTLTVSSSVDSLIGSFRAHLLGRCLPAPAYVQLDVRGRRVAVHPGGLELGKKLGNLLLWAHTLTDVKAEWWRSVDDRLLVSVSGHAAGGLLLEVISGGEFVRCEGLVRLDCDQSESVSIDELATLVRRLRETQADWGPA